jgi:hypothetical protein
MWRYLEFPLWSNLDRIPHRVRHNLYPCNDKNCNLSMPLKTILGHSNQLALMAPGTVVMENTQYQESPKY